MNCHTQDQLTVIVGSIWVSSWLPVLRVTRYHVVNFMMEKAIWQDDAASQTKENKDPNHPHPYKWVWKCILLLLGLCMSTVLATPLNAALIEHTEPKLSHTLNVRGWVFYLSFFLYVYCVCMFVWKSHSTHVKTRGQSVGSWFPQLFSIYLGKGQLISQMWQEVPEIAQEAC